jgi:hypothetical protein
MGIERALGAGAGELDRGRTWRGDDRVRRRSHGNPNDPSRADSRMNPSAGAKPNEPERSGEGRNPGPAGTNPPQGRTIPLSKLCGDRTNPTAVKIERTRAQGKAKGTRASWKSERTQAYVRFQWLCAGRPARSRRCKSVAMKE